MFIASAPDLNRKNFRNINLKVGALTRLTLSARIGPMGDAIFQKIFSILHFFHV